MKFSCLMCFSISMLFPIFMSSIRTNSVYCVNCKYYYLPPHISHTKYGKCTKFQISSSKDILEKDYQLEITPYFYVNGIYREDSDIDMKKEIEKNSSSPRPFVHTYQDAIVCRMMPYLCGKHGYFYESHHISEP
jgi:hypothetical protein